MAKPIVFGSEEARQVLARDAIQEAARYVNGTDWKAEDAPASTEAIVYVNGKVMGNLDDLVKEPTEEFKGAMRELVERAMPVQAAFDYSQIDEGIRDEVKQAARSIHQLSAGVVTGIVAIGKRLIEVKGMLPHGQFIEWVLGEFSVTERTAQNYMNVAREYGDSQKRNSISLFSPTVAYLLAAPSTPGVARAEVEQAAAQGQKVTVEFAKEAIRKAKPEPVNYAPVWELESTLGSWLATLPNDKPDPALDSLKEYYLKGGWGMKFAEWLDVQPLTYRRNELMQAINNVRDQRRQAKLQASARAVYVEPKADKVPGQEYIQAVINQPRAEPTPDLIVAQLIDPHTTTAGTGPLTFHGAIQAASVMQLQEALRLMPNTLWRGRGPVLQAALKKRGVKLKPEPEPPTEADPRVASIKRMMDDYEALRRRINADFGRLTGKHTLIPPFERAGMALMVALATEIDKVGGKEE